MPFKKTLDIEFADEKFQLIQLTRQQILDCAALGNPSDTGRQLILLSCIRDGKPLFESADQVKEELSLDAEEIIADAIYEFSGIKKKFLSAKMRSEKSALPMPQDSPTTTICEQNSQTVNTGISSNITTE